jgi:glycosyltransferase involved in cell wall biosynthesis
MKKYIKKISIVTETLTTGGAETFVLRLAAAFQASGMDVFIFVLRGEYTNQAMVRRMFTNGRISAAWVPLLAVILKLDGLLFRMRVNFSLLQWMQVRQLRRFIARVKPDVVHAHLLTADLVSARACGALGIPWVSTMHGDYLAMEPKGSSQAARIPNFLAACREVEQSVGQMVCITDPQVQQLQRLMPSLAAAGRISKIYNGYAANKVAFGTDDLPELLHQIPSAAFVIGMVARGIKNKGWDVLVGAFLAMGLPDAWLVLVGDGDHLQKLQATHRHPRIVFCGNVVDPLRYIARFDVACLPSQFPTESLPTVVIEYMVLGKPVIATEVGEIPAMLEALSEAPAGQLIELGDTDAMVPRMHAALRQLHHDEALRAAMGANALRAAKKFDMDACVDAYLDVYARVQR